MIYFILFPEKISRIIQNEEKKQKKKIIDILKLKKNKDKNINIYNIKIIKKNLSKSLMKAKNNLKRKKKFSNPPIKKKTKLKRDIKRNNLKPISGKIKLEEKTNAKLIKNKYNFRDFKILSEEKIYKLHKTLYTKTDNELNELSYKEALKYDNRNYFIHYFSLIKCNHLLFFSFMPKFDFNSRIIKMYLFFFNFTTLFFVNALFFTDETMGKINTDGGYFNFIYNLPQIIY